MTMEEFSLVELNTHRDYVMRLFAELEDLTEEQTKAIEEHLEWNQTLIEAKSQDN